jgi:hypothetical protein
MLRIREQYDADLIKRYDPAEYMVDENRFPMPCSVCGNEFYVDKATLRRYERAVGFDTDNTFVCRVCEGEYDELSHR